MHKIVLLRHGQSAWNLENRFTGWTDVDLTEQGQAEARAAGRELKKAGFEFDLVFGRLEPEQVEDPALHRERFGVSNPLVVIRPGRLHFENPLDEKQA